MPTPPDPHRPGTSRKVAANRRRLLLTAMATIILLTVVTVRGLDSDRTKRPEHLHPTPVATPRPLASAAAPTFRGWRTTRLPPGHLARGSDPAVLPGPVLIADKLNNRLLIVDPQGRIRWEFPAHGDLAPGQTFLIPDDAFFTPDGNYIVATQEDDDVITLIDPATGRIVWRYGQPGVPGSGPDRVDNPDDAMRLPNGDVLAADIKNCRVILIPPLGHTLVRQFGTTGACVHNPPTSFGSPNGAFPMRDGDWLVTEINGDWVDELTPSGRVRWSVHPPDVNYPSDSNQIGPDRYLTVDWSSPGQVVVFNQAGRTLWRYDHGLNHPSLALPLPNGDILLNDDHNHRVIVIDPRTNRIVWQYGHDGVPGSAPGYLDNPDGVDLLPPHSFLDTIFDHG